MSGGRAAFSPEGKWYTTGIGLLTETPPEWMWFCYTATLWHHVTPGTASVSSTFTASQNAERSQSDCAWRTNQAGGHGLNKEVTLLQRYPLRHKAGRPGYTINRPAYVAGRLFPNGNRQQLTKMSSRIYLYVDKQNVDFWGFHLSIQGLMMSPTLASLEFLGQLTFWCINQLRASPLLDEQ